MGPSGYHKRMQKTPPIIVGLTRLYDHHKQELCTAISSGNFPLSDIRLKDKIAFLREIASTLSVVMQVEKLRSKDPNPEVKLPDEQANSKDPSLEKKRKDQPQTNMNPNPDLNSFPGGWQPWPSLRY